MLNSAPISALTVQFYPQLSAVSPRFASVRPCEHTGPLLSLAPHQITMLMWKPDCKGGVEQQPLKPGHNSVGCSLKKLISVCTSGLLGNGENRWLCLLWEFKHFLGKWKKKCGWTQFEGHSGELRNLIPDAQHWILSATSQRRRRGIKQTTMKTETAHFFQINLVLRNHVVPLLTHICIHALAASAWVQGVGWRAAVGVQPLTS